MPASVGGAKSAIQTAEISSSQTARRTIVAEIAAVRGTAAGDDPEAKRRVGQRTTLEPLPATT